MPSPDGIILGFNRVGKEAMACLIGTFTLVLILAVCEGSPTPTPAPPPTSTSIPTATAAPTATPVPTSVPPPTSTAVPTSTAAPTATRVPLRTPVAAPAPGAGLLAKLSLIPASFVDEGVWYGDMGRALEIAGVQAPRSRDDLTQSDSVRDAYSDARRGIVLAPGFLGGVRSEPGWEEVFGFNGYEVTEALGFGGSPLGNALPSSTAYLEGDFDDGAIRQKLQDLGYEEIEASSRTYFSMNDDNSWGSLARPGAFALSSMNRVYVSGTALIVAPDTAFITGMLATWASESPSLADDAAFSSIALALGDPLSAGLFTREAIMNPESGGPVDLSQFEKPAEWGTFHEWSDMGAGYGRGDESEWWVISLFYSDPDAGDADADELIQRMWGYDTSLPELVERGWLQQPIDQSCSELTAETRQHEHGSTLSIRCTMREEGTTALYLVDFRDLGFLLP